MSKELTYRKNRMKGIVFTSMMVIVTLLLCGCAAAYRPINPRTINYTAHDLQDGIGFSYKYDVLRERGNKKYARHENKRGVKVVAVKITNNTDTVFNIGRDAAFYSGESQLVLMEPIVIKHTIEQLAPTYLLYLIMIPVKLYVSDGYSVDTYPIGYFLGPGLALGNTLAAGGANNNLKNELLDYNILNRDIRKGETVYGIIGFRDMGYNPITMKMVKK